MYGVPRPWANMLSFGCLGGLLMTPFSAGSAARARPGSPSVTRLIQSIWIGSKGIGKPKKGARNMVHISPELLVMVYFMNFRILSKISSAFFHRLNNGGKIVIEEYHVGCFF